MKSYIGDAIPIAGKVYIPVTYVVVACGERPPLLGSLMGK